MRTPPIISNGGYIDLAHKRTVDKVINYARNPEKTHDKEKLSELHEIEGVVEYAADEMKTEKRAYVTCLHLHSEETGGAGVHGDKAADA